jgi:hypothetical protein
MHPWPPTQGIDAQTRIITHRQQPTRRAQRAGFELGIAFESHRRLVNLTNAREIGG